MLFQLKEIDVNLGLYRDDGLGALTKRPQVVDRVKKQICEIFRRNGLKISVEANLKSVEFLDVKMDLPTNSYKPYIKPNNLIQYVHSDSNHPPAILKNIPLSINKRLSSLSSSEEMFNEIAPK